MALINTLRNRAGKFVVFMVAAAIAAFTLNDLFGSGSSFLRGENNVGEINGYKISIQEYREEMQYQENSFRLRSQRNPTENDKFMINENTWLWLIGNYGFGEQYDELGLRVTRDELWDMIQGANMDPTIQQVFTNPQTGQFDRDFFNSFIQSNPETRNAQLQFIWSVVFRQLGPARERLKYENLVLNSIYANSLEGKQAYHAQSDVADVEYLYIPYYSLSDTAVESQITESMISDYYNENKEDYKIDASRDIEYVTFEIKASAEDTTELLDELAELKEEFTEAADDSAFAYINTEETGIPFFRYHHGIIPTQLKDQIDSLKTGEIYGPYLERGIYHIYKVGEIYDDSVTHTRARHIFFNASTDSQKETARIEADSVLNMLKAGANFALMANQYSDDTQSRQTGGDLGWIPSNTEAPGQETLVEAISSATTIGLVPEVIETNLGLHIVDITELPTNRIYEVSSIQRTIIASDRTENDIFKKADIFQSEAKDIESFRSVANEKGYVINSESEITAMERFIGDLGNARGIVQWTFREGEEGKVSDLYPVNGNYVVAVVTKEVEEGYQDLDFSREENGRTVFPVKDDIKVELRKQLKAEKIIQKLSALSGSLEDIKSAYGDGAEVYSTASLKLESNSVPSVGVDPVAVGTFFSLESGQTSEPFSTDNGVYIARLNNITIAPEVADYSAFSLAVQTTRRNSVMNDRIRNLIMENSDIVDRRYLEY